MTGFLGHIHHNIVCYDHHIIIREGGNHGNETVMNRIQASKYETNLPICDRNCTNLIFWKFMPLVPFLTVPNSAPDESSGSCYFNLL